MNPTSLNFTTTDSSGPKKKKVHSSVVRFSAGTVFQYRQ